LNQPTDCPQDDVPLLELGVELMYKLEQAREQVVPLLPPVVELKQMSAQEQERAGSQEQ
jgi:hypothetical protein